MNCYLCSWPRSTTTLSKTKALELTKDSLPKEGKSPNSGPASNWPCLVPFCTKERVSPYNDHLPVKVKEWFLDKVPEKEGKYWIAVFLHSSSTCLKISLVALPLFLNFLSPPPQFRHFHLCSLNPSQEYEMATRKWGCIRSPSFFENHLVSKSSSHSTQSAEVKAKRQLNALTKNVFLCTLIPRRYLYGNLHGTSPTKRSLLLFPSPQSYFLTSVPTCDLESVFLTFV